MEFGVEQATRRPGASREVLVLPAPQQHGGMPLLQALAERRSRREFSSRGLPLGVLSNLLWAAFGVNRPELHGRTAPSAHDWEEIDVYAAMADGLYVYDARGHVLEKRLDADIRKSTGLQDFAAEAPLNLVYVADLSRMHRASAEEKAQYAGPDAGFIAQNVYLFCASEGLATVVRGMVDRPALAKLAGFGPHHRIILAQSVGYPATG
jgi:SagB-type dehydrogenase family enzyme